MSDKRRFIIFSSPTSLERAAGVPDYFYYNEGDDWFFTEAKNEHDGLRLNQLNWFYKHKYPTKILYLADDREP